MNSNWSYSPETPNLGQNRRFFVPCDLQIWRMTLKNNRAPLLSNIKLYASFHHMWIQTEVTARKRLNGVMTSVTLTFDLWPWPFARTSHLSSVTTSENFMMIRWWVHSQKGVTDRQTDGLNQSLSCLVAAKNIWIRSRWLIDSQFIYVSYCWSQIQLACRTIFHLKDLCKCLRIISTTKFCSAVALCSTLYVLKCFEIKKINLYLISSRCIETAKIIILHWKQGLTYPIEPVSRLLMAWGRYWPIGME